MTNKPNLGNVLNKLAADGWVLDKDIVIPRHPLYSIFTRHKLHLIMKKEYQDGENPFLLFEEQSFNDEDPKDVSKIEETEEYLVTDDSAIIVSKHDSDGTWYDAMKYCETLGEGWKLPNSEQVKYICDNCDIKFHSCWTDIEVNDKKAKVYFRGYTSLNMTKLKSNTDIGIIAIKVVGKDNVE